jgi:hypothetical protein
MRACVSDAEKGPGVDFFQSSFGGQVFGKMDGKSSNAWKIWLRLFPSIGKLRGQAH